MENIPQLKKQIFDFVDHAINEAEKAGQVDYIALQISNHQGNLQMDYTLRKRKKVY